MSVYLDASVLFAFFVPDAHSASAGALLGTGEQAVVSTRSVAEFYSPVAKAVRTDELGQEDRAFAEQALDRWTAGKRLLAVADGDVVAAGRLVRRPDLVLRTPDALHIAVALRTGHALATYDRGPTVAARIVGVPVLGL